MYKKLDHLSKENYVFTPFSQRAMAEVFDPKWRGSCAILANEWMLRKTLSNNMMEPDSYRIDDLTLPHPVVTKENEVKKGDLGKIKQEMSNIFEIEGRNITEFEAEENEDRKKLDHESQVKILLNILLEPKYHCGVIKSLFLIYNSDDEKYFSSDVGHATAFVKKDNHISFFDPNHGEITFSDLDTFSKWFEKEALDGALVFLTRRTDRKTFDDLGLSLGDDLKNPGDSSKDEKDEKVMKERVAEIMKSKQKKREGLKLGFSDYEITSFSASEIRTPHPGPKSFTAQGLQVPNHHERNNE